MRASGMASLQPMQAARKRRKEAIHISYSAAVKEEKVSDECKKR
jgi:hypothetical protein